MARLCRMTAVYGGGFRLVFRPRKTGPQSPPSLPKRRRSSYSNFRIVCCGGLWQEIRDQERPLSLKRDDLGILPNSGSIDGITPSTSNGQVGVQLNGAPEFLLRAHPIPIRHFYP